MPELPDVAGSCRLFATHLAGKYLTSVIVRNPIVVRGRPVDEFIRRLQGQRFEQPSRHGKWLLARTRGPTLLIHLGMTGRLRWEARESAALRFDRVDLCLEDGKLVFQDQRNLGGLWLAADRDEVREVIGDLGPDAFGLTAQVLEERFAGPRMVKALLMDQSILAGLGNMLSDEVLWRARIHPCRRYNDLEPEEVQALARSLHRVLTDSVKVGEIPRGPTWLASQRSQVNPRCPRCRTGLRTNRIAGRTSHWCPVCQVDQPRPGTRERVG